MTASDTFLTKYFDDYQVISATLSVLIVAQVCLVYSIFFRFDTDIYCPEFWLKFRVVKNLNLHYMFTVVGQNVA